MCIRDRDKYHTATLLITHDLGVVAQMCEKVAIIYAGEVVESGAVLDIYKHTLHPYTCLLYTSPRTLLQGKMDGGPFGFRENWIFL